jgi:glycosyltransferase involved in cell wall biosynthesis
MNILVHAYQVSPYKGSEFSVAWNYIINMSKNHNLYVVCGQSSYYMGDFTDLIDYLHNNDMKNVQFFMVKPSRVVKLLNLYCPISFTSPTFYLAYQRWQKEIYHLLKRNVELINNIDIIHFLGPIGYREPGYLQLFPKPYIWGPVGGLNNINPVFIKNYSSLFNKTKALLKNFINNLQIHYSYRVSKAIKESDVILAATKKQQEIIKINFRRDDVLYLTENKILDIPYSDIIEEYINKKYVNLINRNDKLKIVWIGSLIDRKMPKLVIDIAEKITNNKEILFVMIGDGYLKEYLKTEIGKKNLNNRIKLLGNLSRQDVLHHLKEAHLHLLTSSMEGNATVLWESLSLYTPTISLNHCGMADTICDNCGIKIDIGSYNEIVNNFVYYINKIIENPQYLKSLAVGCSHCADKFTWNQQISSWEIYYKTAKQRYNMKSKKISNID